MAGYRFCRPDDAPLLIEAINSCYTPHFPGEALETFESFKDKVRKLDLWASSCMIAYEGKTLVGVLIGCKRPHETFVLKLGVHSDHQRKGHARHMLKSLGSKLAVLGPKRMVTEIPATNVAAITLFKSLGYEVIEESSAPAGSIRLERDAEPGE